MLTRRGTDTPPVNVQRDVCSVFESKSCNEGECISTQ
jgi:hypothetical protein